VASDPAALADDKIQLRRLVQQAVQLRGQARIDEAVSALRQAMKLDPENADLHRELGITFLMAKEWKRARVEMIEAIRIDQNDADAHNGLGYALEKLGDIDGAAKEYRTATHLEPDDPTYLTHYLNALVKIQERREMKK
jgi:Flp pilus assembly protein TadD